MSRHRSTTLSPDPPIDRIIQYVILPHQETGRVPWEKLNEFYQITDHLVGFWETLFTHRAVSVTPKVASAWGLTWEQLNKPTSEYCPIGIALIFIHFQEQ